MGRESFVDVLIGSASEVVVLNRVYIFFFVHLIFISILRFISLLCLFGFFLFWLCFDAEGFSFNCRSDL